MATFIPILIIIPLRIILKINVFSQCWCLHLSISREPLFTKTDQHKSPEWVTFCTSRERPTVTVNTQFFSTTWKMPRFVFVLASSGHIPTTNMSMFTISPLLKGLKANNYSSIQSGVVNFILLCLLPVMILMASWICVEPEKVNAVLEWPQSYSVKWD